MGRGWWGRLPGLFERSFGAGAVSLRGRRGSALGVSWNPGKGRTCPPQLQTGSFARDTPVGAAHPQQGNRLRSASVGAFWMANQPHLAMSTP